MAAHASCADAALADDRHWDAIASREPDAGDEEPATQPAGTDQGRTAGCLPVLAAGIAVGMLVGFAPL
jgi:hypothetical protein